MLWSDLNQLVGATLLIVGAVLPVVNPLGDAPLFLQMTEGMGPGARASLARRVAVYSFGLLFGSMLLGSFVLRLFDLSLPVVQVAGGAVVCALGWKLLNQDESAKPAGLSAPGEPADMLARALYPLTLPLTVDPGSISVAITVGVNHAHSIESTVVKLVAALLSSVLIAVTILLAYRYAWRLSQAVGQRWMTVVIRLSAFIVLCIGVQIVWTGLRTLGAESGLLRPVPASSPVSQ
ncbi:MAG TPA: MarC family protein [Myxococcaceae bacterium]|nr:MarC family protein [Myxococcaceae bacterium]